jgi:hypothetical protein
MNADRADRWSVETDADATTDGTAGTDGTAVRASASAPVPFPLVPFVDKVSSRS